MKRILLIGLLLVPLACFGDFYGAIAINPKTGSVGYSYDYSSRAGAESRALSHCTGRDCKIAVWFNNTCGAVAYSPSTKKYGWGWGNGYESGALSECRRAAGRRARDCKIVASVCTSYYY